MPEQEKKQGVEDIFKESGGEDPDQNVLRPDAKPTGDSGTAKGAPAVPPVMPGPVAASGEPAKKGGPLKKFLLVLIIVIVVLFLLIGGYMVYSTYLRDNQNSGPAENNVNQTIENSPSVTNQTNAPVNQEPVEVIEDKDGDGLSDQEEKELGSDPKLSDSDQDDLFDLEEVRVYKTDPTNPDTDKDGFQDGEEVYNGFDPNGPGELRSLKDEINKLKE